jgi:hypothetical protein
MQGHKNVTFATADNKIYLLRSLRCRSSSRARPLRDKDRGRRTSGTLVLCAATSRFGHILTCSEDATSQNVKVNSTLSEMR